MNTKVNFENILFLDIETVSEVENFNDLPVEKQELFAIKTEYQRKDEFTPEDFITVPVFGLSLEKLCVYLSDFLSISIQRTENIE